MFGTLLKINDFLNSKTMRVFDFLGAIGILGYAGFLYTQEADNYIFWAIAGSLALFLAILRPTRFFSKKIERSQPNK